MTRVKRGTIKTKKRRRILKFTKGFRWGRKAKERLAKDALLHAFTNMFRGRKEKKRTMRSLWQTKISAGVVAEGINYSRFIGAAKKKNIEIDRKILAQLAEHEPKTFKRIIEEVK
ncbi:MAG: 50S ribosomal protein L20 [Candidatus Harrisonbacteria bacterium CG10_big_fil_rev_8_21_14_0_10_42_17]|uniref:Large ribosomal subunit protein bL20 n=1 Tax=Candidatus Harrisonbacteria bacterium CG10_big_fil_rev_8_21_14_0_10_42_17 TaxID=1974584 RepID=A0A2M6WI43_9BACT|nr:MAG: 50S ribosomal protein L20 [Candidatus Harrisonbacteria bacterium CG10_big_fil_rev_8_21_14_0_10_42_17]